MSAVFKKMNIKDQKQILVINAPSSFETEIEALRGITVMREPDQVEKISFALVFVSRQADLDALSMTLASKAEGDALLWFAYPKGTSKKYSCEFNRDSGWHVLGSKGFEVVRQVAIDADWSALRFRRVEFIKSLSRDPSRRLSKESKPRVSRGQ